MVGAQAGSLVLVAWAYYILCTDGAELRAFYEFYDDHYARANFLLPLKLRDSDAGDGGAPRWALPDDEGPTIDWLEAQASVRWAMSLMRAFWVMQAACLSLYMLQFCAHMKFQQRLRFVGDTLRVRLLAGDPGRRA